MKKFHRQSMTAMIMRASLTLETYSDIFKPIITSTIRLPVHQHAAVSRKNRLMTDELRKYGAAILCGGKSLRMGFDKSITLVSRTGRPLLPAQAEELARHFGEVALITNNTAKLSQVPELSGFRQLTDLHPGAGPAGGIHTALKGMPHKPLFIMACDMPVIDWRVIDRMRTMLEAQGADIVAPRHGDLREPLYAFYGPSVEPVFEAGLAEGLRKVRLFYDSLKTCYLELEDEDLKSGVFINLNTPADVRKEGLPLPEAALKNSRLIHGEDRRK
ncbi:hypothetical protein C4J81_00165 [Deltaproteobacteria bacterium Smac51]|nr:hypothetical protein C4J81_00165 [Deltaproteobacteria bacterium Smac51]